MIWNKSFNMDSFKNIELSMLDIITYDGLHGNIVTHTSIHGLNISNSGIEYTDKDWLRLKVRHYRLQREYLI